MADKKTLGALLPDDAVKPIRRGQGMRLTTDADMQEEIEKSTKVEAEISTEKLSKVERRKPGYEIRTDLLRAAKKLAIDEDRFNYEIVEDALEEYLKKKGRL